MQPTPIFSRPVMLVLFETPAGYALFKMQSDIKGASADDVWKQFTTPEKAAQASAHSHQLLQRSTASRLA